MAHLEGKRTGNNFNGGGGREVRDRRCYAGEEVEYGSLGNVGKRDGSQRKRERRGVMDDSEKKGRGDDLLGDKGAMYWPVGVGEQVMSHTGKKKA